MKVHLICRNWKGDQILPRHMRILADINGWTVGERPKERVDLNHHSTYIEYAEKFSDWHFTPISAHFTHLESQTPYKKFWWELANDRLKFKTYTSNIYREMLKGSLYKVIPPVDPEFDIRDRKKHDKFVVGVSGFVDKSNRKGEINVARLYADDERKYKLVASGYGWPIETINQSLEGLPGYYNGLDVFLCSSTDEGIPMPPLEALACGVPVVIPYRVGLLDELGEHPGIIRYTAGDYDAMKAAIQRALVLVQEGDVDRESLRNVVSRYTPKSWADSHREAFQGMLEGKPQDISIERDIHGKRGMYMVAYGEPARKCAVGAIKSFKEFHPDIPVALASSDPGLGEDIFVNLPDADIGGRSAKTMIDSVTPAEWQYILYLDADTETIADISFLYELLVDGWDMMICKNPGKYHLIRQMKRPDNKDECEETFGILGTDQLIQLNGGVFSYQRNPKTKAFFEAWHREWKRYGKRDQAALLRALWENPLRMYVLGNEWNTITRYDDRERSAGILHFPMTARRWRGILHYRSDDPEAWKRVEEFNRSKK